MAGHQGGLDLNLLAGLQPASELLKHAAGCQVSGSCWVPNCAGMKAILGHRRNCTAPVTGTDTDCLTCTKLRKVIEFHAAQCTALQCPVPLCLQYQCNDE